MYHIRGVSGRNSGNLAGDQAVSNREIFANWIDECWEWLMEKYPDVNPYALNDYNIAFRAVWRGDGNEYKAYYQSWYGHKFVQRKGKTVRYIRRAAIHIQADYEAWHTYYRRSIGIAAPYMQVTNEFAVKCQLVHELTHFIQDLQKRDMSEAETTWNELTFAYERYWKYFSKCQVIYDRRYNINENINCRITCPNYEKRHLHKFDSERYSSIRTQAKSAKRSMNQPDSSVMESQ